MNLKLGEVYKFEFISEFETLNGIYRVDQISSYDQVLRNDVDLFESFYKPAGKTVENLSEDIATLSQLSFIKLTGVLTEDVTYVPEDYVSGIPAADVLEYGKLLMNIDLGVVADQAMIDNIIASVQTVLTGGYGISEEPVLLQYDSTWLSVKEYEDIEAARDEIKTTIPNHYSQVQKLTAELSKKNSRLNYLEQIIKDLNQ